MPDYSVFGWCLRSEQLLFPELPHCVGGAPDCLVRIADGRSTEQPGEILGATPQTQCRIALHRMPQGFRLRHSCSGEFDISSDGSDIVWYPRADLPLEMARNDILGRVLSIALHARGALALHGSAVALERNAVAFLGPKHRGKSTLATALIRAGGTLLTDDTIAVDVLNPAILSPGIRRARLYEDSARMLFDEEENHRHGLDGKYVVQYSSDSSQLPARIPLSAVYILKPMSRDLPTAATRIRLSSRHAVISIISNSKVGQLLGSTAARAIFELVTTLVQSTPVYTLQVVRDLERIDEVVEIMSGWHDLAAPVEV
jgi:hypothetical protein